MQQHQSGGARRSSASPRLRTAALLGGVISLTMIGFGLFGTASGAVTTSPQGHGHGGSSSSSAPATSSQSVHVKPSTLDGNCCGQGQVAIGALFVITKIANPPASIDVTLSDHTSHTVPLSKVPGGSTTAQYELSFDAGLSVKDAVADLPGDWQGEFNLSHYICANQTSTPPTTPSSPETTPSSPETTPSTPETTPSTPETTPSTPETTPSTPETTPTTPETTPTTPETTPTSPTPIGGSGTPTTTPAESTTPVESTTPASASTTVDTPSESPSTTTSAAAASTPADSTSPAGFPVGSTGEVAFQRGGVHPNWALVVLGLLGLGSVVLFTVLGVRRRPTHV